MINKKVFLGGIKMPFGNGTNVPPAYMCRIGNGTYMPFENRTSSCFIIEDYIKLFNDFKEVESSFDL